MLKSKLKSELSNRITSPLPSANRGAQSDQLWQCGVLLAAAGTHAGTFPNGNTTTKTRLPDGFSAWLYQRGGYRPW